MNFDVFPYAKSMPRIGEFATEYLLKISKEISPKYLDISERISKIRTEKESQFQFQGQVLSLDKN